MRVEDEQIHHQEDGSTPAIQGLSPRACAAIALRVPESGVGWLDSMIERAASRDAATKIMASLVGNYGAEILGTPAGEVIDLVERAYLLASTVVTWEKQ